MPTATITVQYVNPVKPGNKTGSIKTTDGEIYRVDPTQLGQFQVGNTYPIEYETWVSKQDGREHRTFRRMDGALPLSHPMAPITTGRPAQTQAVEMFVMGVIGRSLQGVGTLPDREILTTWVKALRWAWIDGFAAISKPEDDEREF